MKEECIICKAPLIYLEKDEMMEAIVPYAANSIISKFVNINNLSMRQ